VLPDCIEHYYFNRRTIKLKLFIMTYFNMRIGYKKSKVAYKGGYAFDMSYFWSASNLGFRLVILNSANMILSSENFSSVLLKENSYLHRAIPG
jgi:hypothetical protein